METSWHSYPKVWNIGHPQSENLFKGPVIVQEKIDGSQFSFGIFDGELKVRSKGKEMPVDYPEKMFDKAVETVLKIKGVLKEGWTYRAEYLSKPKHNTLAYDRTPKDYLIVFDINPGYEQYLTPEGVKKEASRLDLECVPTFYKGEVNTVEKLKELLETVSYLGGQKIEGIVVKNYSQFGRDGKVVLGKHVSEKFREMNGVDWAKRNPSKTEFMQILIDQYRTEARWEKAVQHLKEAGQLENSPRDIGKLIKEAEKDFIEECKEEIMLKLWNHFSSQMVRRIRAGIPEWYKERLLKSAFKND